MDQFTDRAVEQPGAVDQGAQHEQAAHRVVESIVESKSGAESVQFAAEAERKAARLRATPQTIQLVRADDQRRNRPAEPARDALLQSTLAIAGDAPASIDLGGRMVYIVPRAGHTASDLTVELEDPRIVIAGDLFWNRMFPNFVDAVPSVLTRSVWAVGHEPASSC